MQKQSDMMFAQKKLPRQGTRQYGSSVIAFDFAIKSSYNGTAI